MRRQSSMAALDVLERRGEDVADAARSHLYYALYLRNHG